MSFLRYTNLVVLMTLIPSAFAMQAPQNISDPYFEIYDAIYKYYKPHSQFKKDILKGAPVYGKSLSALLDKYPTLEFFEMVKDQEKKNALLIYDAWLFERNMNNEGDTNSYSRLKDDELSQSAGLMVKVFGHYKRYAQHLEKLEKAGLKEDDSARGYKARQEHIAKVFEQKYPEAYKIMTQK